MKEYWHDWCAWWRERKGSDDQYSNTVSLIQMENGLSCNMWWMVRQFGENRSVRPEHKALKLKLIDQKNTGDWLIVYVTCQVIMPNSCCFSASQMWESAACLRFIQLESEYLPFEDLGFGMMATHFKQSKCNHIVQFIQEVVSKCFTNI